MTLSSSSLTPSAQSRRRPGRWVIILLALVLTVLVARRIMGMIMGMPEGMMGMGDAPVPVSVAPAMEVEATVWHSFSGRLEAIDRAEVRSRISGTVERIYFRDGAEVKRGQPLFLIDPAPFKAELARAEGEVARAEAERATAQLQASRARRLMAENAIARSEYESRLGAEQSARGALAAARGARDAARVNLRYTAIYAPINGRASRAEITTGNIVDAGAQGRVLTTIVAQDPLYVEFEVDEATFLSTLRGITPATFTQVPVEMQLGQSESSAYIAGRISSFDNQMDAGSGTLRVRAIFDNRDRSLIPGLFARIRMGSTSKQSLVVINDQAISTDQSTKLVYVVGDNNTLTPRPVALGTLEDGLRVITSGLQAGERIVVNGLGRVRPGMVVAPRIVDMRSLAAIENTSEGATPAASPSSSPSAATTSTATP